MNQRRKMTDTKPPVPSDKLPKDIESCHNLIRDLFSRIAELEKHLSRRNRMVFGKKSAKVDAELLTGTGKAIHQQTSFELEEESRKLNVVQNKGKGGGRSKPSETIPTRIEEHRIEDTEIPCPECSNPREIFGFEVHNQIDFVQTTYENLQHRIFKYICTKCNRNIVKAKKKNQPIDKGRPGPGLLAKIATDKFWLHTPLYRQEQVFQSLSLPIKRASMCRWIREIAWLVSPVVERMRQKILQSRSIQSDATTLPVIKKGLGKTHRSFVWVYLGDKTNPYIYYDYSNTEHSIYPEKILKGFKGILLTDGTNKYNQIIEDGATSANCWAHVHCYFEDAWKEDPNKAEFPMGVIKSLFDIERFAISLSENERKDIRLKLAKPKIEQLRSWLDIAKFTEPPKTKLGEAITYTLNRWPALLTYLDNPFVDISNNTSERSIKPLVISRKNWLFAGSEEGGKSAATILSLVETCKRLGINPFEYLKDILIELPSAKISQIDEYLPDRWLALQKARSDPEMLS